MKMHLSEILVFQIWHSKHYTVDEVVLYSLPLPFVFLVTIANIRPLKKFYRILCVGAGLSTFLVFEHKSDPLSNCDCCCNPKGLRALRLAAVPIYLYLACRSESGRTQNLPHFSFPSPRFRCEVQTGYEPITLSLHSCYQLFSTNHSS
jgi:hypothetical protein